MRTTVTLDPDAEQIVRDRMAAKGVSFKRALNDAIRDGAQGRVDVAFSTMSAELGEPRIDITRANQLAADLEDMELVEKMRAGR